MASGGSDGSGGGGGGDGPAPDNDGLDYSKQPNVRPDGVERVPDVKWARWRLCKQRPEIRDNFPDYFPDIRAQMHQRLTARIQQENDDQDDQPRQQSSKRSLKELKSPYEPTQLWFAHLAHFYDEADRLNAKLSPRERLDTDGEGDKIPSIWFERMAHDLFARVWEFSSDTFGLDSLGESYNDQDWTRRWLEKLPREFVDVASQVARGDPTVKAPKDSDPNNWEFLFLDSMSRVKLMVGIMAKLLEKNVFNSLLFGARDVEKAALNADDCTKSFIDNSYQRNRSRSQSVRQYIQGNRPTLGTGLQDLLTDNFWEEVESVTIGILDLLLPLINILEHDMPGVDWPALTQVHQRLHDIVAEAAWLTNGMRATRSVFWIDFPIPGELNDIKHEHAIDDIWNRSKREATDRDAANIRQWEATREATLTQQNPGVDITDEHRTAYAANNPRPYVRRTAKVQVAMWPFIKRFTPVRERDAGDGAYNSGEIVNVIMKAQAVYYFGDDSDEGDFKERRTLREQIGRGRWAKWISWFSWTSLLLCVLGAFLLLLISVMSFPQSLDYYSWPTRSSNGFVPKGTSTSVVLVPVGTEIITGTIVAPGPDDDGVPKATETTMTVLSVPIETDIVIETAVVPGPDDDGVPSVPNPTEIITTVAPVPIETRIIIETSVAPGSNDAGVLLVPKVTETIKGTIVPKEKEEDEDEGEDDEDDDEDDDEEGRGGGGAGGHGSASVETTTTVVAPIIGTEIEIKTLVVPVSEDAGTPSVPKVTEKIKGTTVPKNQAEGGGGAAGSVTTEEDIAAGVASDQEESQSSPSSSSSSSSSSTSSLRISTEKKRSKAGGSPQKDDKHTTRDEVTTSEATTSTEDPRETVTITVPADKDVFIVTGPAIERKRGIDNGPLEPGTKPLNS